MRRLILPLLCPLATALLAYSIFNTRGLGGYIPPSDFLRILPRDQTRIEASFLLEYDYATDGKGGQEAFLARPDRFRFFVPLPGRFGINAQIVERFNLDFEVSSDSARSANYTLVRRVTGRGGIDGLRLALDKSLFNIVYLAAGYERLFGGAWERWDSEIVELKENTVDSLLYHFSGDMILGMAGLHLGNFEVRGFFGYPFDLRINTEVQTARDTTTVDSADYQLPVEFGGILNLSLPKLELNLSYIHEAPPASTDLVPGRTLELNAQWNLESFSLRGRLGWMNWYALTRDSSSIQDIYLGVGTLIPIASYGYGKIDLSGGLRQGGRISEYHVELRLGLEFKEFWKRRERMWGG